MTFLRTRGRVQVSAAGTAIACCFSVDSPADTIERNARVYTCTGIQGFKGNTDLKSSGALSKTSSRGSDAAPTDNKRIKALQEEVQKLKQQLRQ
jgi:hypothetical protein